MPQSIQPSSIRHAHLPERLLAQIRWIHRTFAEVDDAPLEDVIDDFRRDAHPADEVRIWQRLAAAYRLYGRRHPDLTLPQKQQVYATLLRLIHEPEGEPSTGTEAELRSLVAGMNQAIQ